LNGLLLLPHNIGQYDFVKHNSLIRKGIVVSEDSKVTLYSPLTSQLLFMKIYHCNRPEMDLYENDLSKFMEDALQQMSAIDFKHVYSKNTEGACSEALFQKVFYKIACSLLRKESMVSVEVTQIEDIQIQGGHGGVDFHVNKDRDWAVEFVISKNMEMADTYKHNKRFDDPKKYGKFGFEQSLLIDFRPANHLNKTFVEKNSKLKRAWFVLYDSVNYTKFWITKYDSEGNKTVEHKEFSFKQEVKI